MDELESFFEVFAAGIVILISMVASARKAKTKRIADAARQSRAQEQTAAEEPAQPWTPAQPTVLPPMIFSDIPGQEIAPTVHPHIEPDCDTHDKPGSLGVTSTEGKDPCHEEQLTHIRPADAAVQEASGLTFDWSGENMVKAFVMQEVLTRPAARRQAR